MLWMTLWLWPYAWYGFWPMLISCYFCMQFPMNFVQMLGILSLNVDLILDTLLTFLISFQQNSYILQRKEKWFHCLMEIGATKIKIHFLAERNWSDEWYFSWKKNYILYSELAIYQILILQVKFFETRNFHAKPFRIVFNQHYSE